MNADLSPSAMDLAREAPFRLGAVEVHPSLSEVEWQGAREALQPKVMQVLVALAHARGEVVSREGLIDACWGGRAVGDDAIHRCIAQLRRLAGRTGAFTVETIPRVGHRLTVDGPAARRDRWRPILIAFVAMLAATVAVGTWWTLRGADAPSAPRVQVTAVRVIGGGADVQTLAQGLGADVAGLLNEAGVQTTLSPAAAGERRAAFRVNGTVRAEAGRLYVRMFLEDPRAGLTLWSREISGPTGDSARLREAAAAAAADAIWMALEPRRQRGLKLDPETLALHIRGGEQLKHPSQVREREALRSFEQVAARAPAFAAGRGNLAMMLAIEATMAPQTERAALRERARREAQAAIRIDAAAGGAAYEALYRVSRLERPAEIAAAEDQVLEGLRRAPEHPLLHMRECRLLTEVGRAAEALPYCQRAVALRPFAPLLAFTLAWATYVDGDLTQARQTIEEGFRRDPDHGLVRLARFELEALSGSAARAKELLHGPDTTPQFAPAVGQPALDAFLKARASGRPADAEFAAQALLATGDDGRLDYRLAVRALAALGRTEDAFALMERPKVREQMATVNNGFLVEPSTAQMRRDPRFWAAAERVGLIAYWTQRNAWPDFCGREVTLASCQAQASAALKGPPPT